MHLLTNYSRSTLLRIDKPILYPTYFQIPQEKYIVVCNSTAMPGKNPAHLDDILFFLRDGLREKGYKIAQIGGKDDLRLQNIDYFFCGQTNYNQLYYVIQHASLCLSGDTFCIHIAGVYDIPICGLYGLTDPLVSGAYFGDKSKQTYLEPDRTKYPPSFNPNDASVNHIKIETVVQSVEKLLNLSPSDLDSVLFIGDKYNIKLLECAPNVLLEPKVFANSNVIFRYDLESNNDVLCKNLLNIKGNITTNKEIPLELLKGVRHNILNLHIELVDGITPEYINKCKKLGVHIVMFTKETDEQKLNDIKFRFFEIDPIYLLPNQDRPEVLNNLEEKEWERLYYKTNRFLISNGQLYGGEVQMKDKKAFKDSAANFGPAQKNPVDFWVNSDSYLVWRAKVKNL